MQDERLPKRGGGQSDGDAEGRRRERVQRRSVVFANMPNGICNADVRRRTRRKKREEEREWRRLRRCAIRGGRGARLRHRASGRTGPSLRITSPRDDCSDFPLLQDPKELRHHAKVPELPEGSLLRRRREMLR
ncbi:hypothetical protein F2P81_003127 [Scophthalmus maximus]|uniref:Uncharacterized protein n=1 Tax=Scophthalmus maximus TaxID=52904 RepID=A0A6A4TGL3_SCOMX|nr:hypothetical protein F2P81_003127 [Scophthalmus maximus]